MDELSVTFRDGDLVVGVPLPNPARRLAEWCLVRREHGPRFEVHYDDAGRLAYVFVGGAPPAWRAERLAEQAYYPPGVDDGISETLSVDAASATVQFTDDSGMYLWEPGEERPPGIARWNGVSVDLTGGLQDRVDGRQAPGHHWGDWFPTEHCHPECRLSVGDRPSFGLCLDESGRINGILFEGPAGDVPQPVNAVLRERSSGRWPDNLD